ncbi:MAG: UvrB/UvrC motif-containing protein [Patescibacteria group bacterium]
MNLEQFKKKMKKIPDTPGVYFFLDKTKKVLYIGKATSLRDRTRSYFSPDLATTRGPLITSMIEKASSLDWRQTDSVLEALILEANLIRTYKPKHNTDLKDDKSWNYVVITKENFPRVLLVRGKNLETEFPEASRLYTFGPFPHGLQLREALKIIRKIFPYRDTCTPAEVMLAAGKKPKACFNHQVGLCPGVCDGSISKTEYQKIIRRIVLLFSGKKVTLLKSLERDMKQAAKEERFEEAGRLRSQVFALNHIQDVSLIKDEYRSPSLGLGTASTRIEAYDVAHLAGTSHVGVMVVVENGEPLKNDYRKFRLRKATPGDDPGSLKEILSRRLGHDEWPLPRIIAVDGSVAQINAAEAVLKEYGMMIPVVGVVKDEKHRPRDIRGDRELIKGRERDILLANSEAHRFAIGYHRADRNKQMGLR